ncbi:Serine/threonine-protein kinase PknB [Thalassoglobus neptunius]|uniref:non-specific serine/threonine protein kinase n=1 Tax=Thalassoglobus neptunius TaxID=1938619 RepID=A0A5C5X4K1_9PLAN|nr:serine/threonine-protein kinase [Thalassoglobus neptunius]TWT57509.1 Serine/threonine-protein kinase PknB [Thalassoglobus neptunius]
MTERLHNFETDLLGTFAGGDESTTSSDDSQTPITPEIPGYRILSILGKGGMGQVYLAEDLKLKRQVALKVVAGGAASTPEMLERFQAEARAVAAVKHPGVCHIFEAGEAGSIPYLAMEVIQGKTVSELIREQLPTPKQSAKLANDIAKAVHACHESGILHRDLKPSNVMVTNDGIVKVMDFGLAKPLGTSGDRTRTGEIIGTPSYMAPEQASGVVKQLGPECDVYAIGALIYEMLTGRPPFQTSELMQTIMLVMTTDPVPPRKLQPRVPTDLETICLKCLQKQTRKRYSSALELSEDLERYLNSEPIRARKTPLWEQGYKWSRRHPVLTVFLAMIGLAVMGGLAGVSFHVERLQSELDRNERLFNESQELGRWLVNDHIPALARLAGGGTQRSDLVAKTLTHLHQLQLDVAADEKLAEYIAQAYLQIARVQSDPAFATSESLRQALQSLEDALKLSPQDDSKEASIQSTIDRANLHLERARLFQQLAETNSASDEIATALSQIDQLPKPLPPAGEVTRLAAREMELDLNLQQLTAEEQIEAYLSLLEEGQLLLDSQTDSDKGTEVVSNLAWRIGLLLEASAQAAEQNRSGEAIDYLTMGVDLLSQTEGDSTRKTFELTDRLSFISEVQQSDNQLNEALQSIQTAIDLQLRLASEIPDSSIIKTRQAELLERRFEFEQQLQLVDDMLETAAEHLQVSQEFELLDPANSQKLLQRSHTLIAQAQQSRLRYADAVDHIRQALQIARERKTENWPRAQALEFADLLDLTATLIVDQANDRSAISSRITSLEEAIALLKESEQIYRSVGEDQNSPEDSAFWKNVRQQHRFEEELDRLLLQSRETKQIR